MSATGAGQLTTAKAALEYTLGGHARITLLSLKTGRRYTYQVKASDDGARYYVALLMGPNNEEDYVYLGTIFVANGGGECRYRHGMKSTIAFEAPGAVAFDWAFSFLGRGELPPQCEIYHEGVCGRCGRALTTPESVASGIGPVCAKRGAPTSALRLQYEDQLKEDIRK